ncbi:hypothetical protein RNZ50_11430 [Paracoccaceae bacterium Fryx2]|nr:hypothetical protein [Paracoccaceae bacterium Fryx2]
MRHILILGSGPSVTRAANWPRPPFDHVLAINNAWRVRPDWDALIHPHDFPEDRRPQPGPGQRLVTQEDFVPAQNALGGFVYAGGTMAFTAAYWALFAHAPKVIALLGCDMHYPAVGRTHFYGTGSPDPLRPDITLQSLEAKAARLMVLGARQGCAFVNLSEGPSRLVFPRMRPDSVARARPLPFDGALAAQALQREAELGYFVPSGRYWEEAARFDAAELRALDALWLAAARPALARSA